MTAQVCRLGSTTPSQDSHGGTQAVALAVFERGSTWSTNCVSSRPQRQPSMRRQRSHPLSRHELARKALRGLGRVAGWICGHLRLGGTECATSATGTGPRPGKGGRESGARPRPSRAAWLGHAKHRPPSATARGPREARDSATARSVYHRRLHEMRANKPRAI